MCHCCENRALSAIIIYPPPGEWLPVKQKLLADPPQCVASYSNGPRCPPVCPSVCLSQSHASISETKRDRRMFLGNSDRNQGFPIQNLPSESWSEIQFRHFRYFRVGNSPTVTGIGNSLMNGAMGTVISLCVIWLKFCMITHKNVP